jgi:putative DNA primase/helicase
MALPRNLAALLKKRTPAGAMSGKILFEAFVDAALYGNIDGNEIIQHCMDDKYAGNDIHQYASTIDIQQQIGEILSRVVLDDKGRRELTCRGGDTDELWRQIEQIILEKKLPVYMRGKELVRPLWRWEKAEDKDGKPQGALLCYFQPLTVSRLSDLVAHHAVRFKKFDARIKKLKNIDPPEKVIQALLDAEHNHLPTVVGIVNSPTMRPDGSILQEAGYDAATQLWYMSSGRVTLPEIKEHPTKEDARVELEKLNELISGFPFAGETETNRHSSSRSAALAAIFTTVLRGAFPVGVPLFLITATEAQSGKSFLVIVIGYLATGQYPIPVAGTDDMKELEKRIEGATMEGRAIVPINNIPEGTTVKSAHLAQMTEENACVTVRMLGIHGHRLCDGRSSTFFINGNNIFLASDLVPRAIHCRIDPPTNKPENRKFDFHPIKDRLRDRRGEYIAAVFNIVRAFQKAGEPMPEGMERVTTFELWSKWVQQPLMWLGESDPFGGKEDMRAADPHGGERDKVLSILSKLFKHNDEFMVADCREKAEEVSHTDQQRGVVYLNQELRDLMTVKGKIDNREFGKMLDRHRDRRDDLDRQIVWVRKKDGSSVWRLIDPSPRPASPQAGDSPQPATPQAGNGSGDPGHRGAVPGQEFGVVRGDPF